MPGYRALKQEVRRLLSADDRRRALSEISVYRPRRIINALIACFYDSDELLRWRAVAAAGEVAAGLAESDRESARVIMRRLMWMLNDESGGIGWGSPEAMGEITASSPAMASEYANILCSFVNPGCNFIEHPGLQKGVLWGLGRLSQADPQRVRVVVPDIVSFFYSKDPVHRGYAAWAAGNAAEISVTGALEELFSDKSDIDFFEKWHITRISVGQLARDAVDRIFQAGREN
ncbi:MAG: DVU0298 family protein [Thermodesulfobacteriota bacterium]